MFHINPFSGFVKNLVTIVKNINLFWSAQCRVNLITKLRPTVFCYSIFLCHDIRMLAIYFGLVTKGHSGSDVLITNSPLTISNLYVCPTSGVRVPVSQFPETVAQVLELEFQVSPKESPVKSAFAGEIIIPLVDTGAEPVRVKLAVSTYNAGLTGFSAVRVNVPLSTDM